MEQVDTVMFVDDTNFINVARNPQELESNTEITLRKAQQWFRANMMRMNTGKTQSLTIVLGDPKIDHLTFLGIQLQSDMKFSHHNNQLEKSLSRGIFVIRRMKELADQQAAKVAYFSFLHSAFAYGILVWGSMPGSEGVFINKK